MAMTLESIRDWHREQARAKDVCGELRFPGPNESPFYRYPSEESKQHDAMADAIDAHLTQPAQAVDVARRFHEAYERLAPSFGYETRPETRVFDPESPNGKLMTAVCAEVARALSAEKAGWRVPDENWLADQLCDLRNRWGEHEPGWLETDDNHPDDWMAKELRKRLLDLPASPTTAKEG